MREIVAVNTIAAEDQLPTCGCTRTQDGHHIWTWNFLKGWVCVGCAETLPKFMRPV